MTHLWIWVVIGIWVVAPSAKADNEDIVVYGDRFQRWDGTRWFVASETTLPAPVTIHNFNSQSMRIIAYQMHVLLRCEKDWRITARRWEVLCAIEDLSIQVVPWRSDAQRLEHNQALIDAWRTRLVGSMIQLQVKSNGRVDNVDLEGIKNTNRRDARAIEQMRQLLLQSMAGFDMKLRRNNFLNTGQWVEYRSPLLSLPGSDQPSLGSALIVHQLDRYRGHLLVQTVGEGTYTHQITTAHSILPLNYRLELDGVALYSEANGYMTDRVWSVSGTPSASQFSSAPYFSAGRIQQLGDQQFARVGPSQQVKLAGEKTMVPQWISIEEAFTWNVPLMRHLMERPKPETVDPSHK